MDWMVTQAYWDCGSGYSEERSVRRYVRPGAGAVHCVELDIEAGERIAELRIDPVQFAAALDFYSLEIHAGGRKTLEWVPPRPLPEDAKLVNLRAIVLPDDSYHLATSSDPQIVWRPRQPITSCRVKIAFRVREGWRFDEALSRICAASSAPASLPDQALAAKNEVIRDLARRLDWRRAVYREIRRAISTPLSSLKLALAGSKKKRRISCSVIIPVYNSFAEAKACLESVVRHPAENASVIVVDDFSTEGIFEDAARSIVSRSSMPVRIVRNSKNLGFVASCNRGMRMARRSDPVLLNSDTVVTSGWLDKLRLAAYASPDIGSVTPLTNNGTICSVPRFFEDNEIPLGLDPESFAEIVGSVSARELPVLPSSVGFCTYIKREVCDAVGLFDEKAFGLGYGEENDFSCRLQKAGYLDVLDDSTFVFHKGSSSFGSAKKEALSKRNSEILAERYPDYFERVRRFVEAFPLRAVHDRLHRGILEHWAAGSRASVLHVLHGGPIKERGDSGLGGTELHVQDLIRHVPSIAHWSLVPFRDLYLLEAHAPGFEKEWGFYVEASDLPVLLSSGPFDMVHYHHSLGFSAALSEALIEHGRYIVSLHDMHLLCPRYFFSTLDARVCTGVECSEMCGYEKVEISRLRSSARELLEGAARVVHFSKATRSLVERLLGDGPRWAEIPHSVSPSRAIVDPRPSGEPLRVLVLGSLAPHKGLGLINEAAASLPANVELHHLGRSSAAVHDSVVSHGIYDRSSFAEKLAEIRPHVAAILSLCEESYCMTLDESWSAGLPAIVTPYGAPKERMEISGAGWVLEDVSASGLNSLLARIEAESGELERRRRLTARAPLRSLEDMASDYAKLYEEVRGSERRSGEKLFDYLSRGAPPSAHPFV